MLKSKTALALCSATALLLVAACVDNAAKIEAYYDYDLAISNAKPQWLSYAAKDAVSHGEPMLGGDWGEIATESVYRSCVKLSKKGDSLSWLVKAPANAMVIRHAMPDSEDGNGQEASLSLFVNGQFRQKIALSSHFAWLYGKGENPQSNNPADGPRSHHFFDDAKAFIDGEPLKRGDKLTLTKDSDSAAWHVIDLIDLEMAAAPAQMPEGFISVKDFGATPDDDSDDTEALKACIAKAKAEGKGVWIPKGCFLQNEILLVDGVKIRGAGPWHSRLKALKMSTKEQGFGGNCGFKVVGDDVSIQDLMIEGVSTQRPGPRQRGVVGGGRNILIENVWVEHTDTGIWMGGLVDSAIRGCRFRNTFADGLNINGCSNNVSVERNHCRNNGDDCFAAFSNTDHGGVKGPNRDIFIRNNVADAPWWGQGIGIYGGERIIAEGNLIRAAEPLSGIVVSTGFKSWPGSQIRVEGNDIVACGGVAYDQKWGGIFIHMPGESLGAIVKGNRIERPLFDGIKLQGGEGKGSMDVSATDNRIELPGACGIIALANAKGKAIVKGNIVSSASGKQQFLNAAPAERLAVDYVESKPQGLK